MSLADWKPERIAEELERSRTGWCDTQAHEIARSLLLALQEALEEVERLQGSSCSRCGGEGVIGKHYDSSDVVCPVCCGRSGWLADLDARMKRLGALDALSNLRAELLNYPDYAQTYRDLANELSVKIEHLRREAELIERAREHTITPAEADAQVRSFAFGNTHLANPEITRADVDKAVDALRREGEE